MTRAPWHADHDLDVESFIVALERRFPEFHQPVVEALTFGWDYMTFRVDGDWVFKVPKRADVVSRMRQEVSLLTALPKMTASVPRPAFHGVAASDLRHPFFGYPFLDGVFLTDARADLRVMLPQVLDFLGTLHNIVPPFAVEGWPDGTWVQQIQRLERVRTQVPALAPSLNWLAHHEPSSRRKALLHGDLGPQHLLMNPDTQKLVAVLDWADAALGDPARDLADLLFWAPDATEAAFLDRDGDPAELERGFAYALMGGLAALNDYVRWENEQVAAQTRAVLRVQEAVLGR